MLRPYQASDLPAVTRFIGECWQRDKPNNYHPGDFVHWMSNTYLGARLEHHFHIVEDNDQILAVVQLHEKSGMYAHVMDSRKRAGEWGLEFHRACISIMRDRMQKKDKRTLTVNLAMFDAAGRDCLRQLGFKEQEGDISLMQRSLKSIPEASLPDGFIIRSVAGEHEAQLVADVHNGAFGPKWNEADYLKVMRTPGYDFERELVVVAPDGRFAAFLIVWFDPISLTGFFEPVGCHSDFRQRGLSKALMFEGMVRMKEKGMETAVVGYEPANNAAFKLYSSAGLEAYFETVDCVLELNNS